MDWVEQTKSTLAENGVEFIAYLPDSKISPLVDDLKDDDEFETVLVAREEECIGVLAGAWLGGTRGALICQTDGLANAFNALGSFVKPMRIPFIGLVSRRGNLGEHNLAHVPSGYGMPRLLDDIGIRNHCIDEEADVPRKLSYAIKSAFSVEEPYVLLFETTLTERQ